MTYPSSGFTKFELVISTTTARPLELKIQTAFLETETAIEKLGPP